MPIAGAGGGAVVPTSGAHGHAPGAVRLHPCALARPAAGACPCAPNRRRDGWLTRRGTPLRLNVSAGRILVRRSETA
ncbi:hypothetical protein CZ771_02630 [Actinomycetales bacterium JB111]|nr:hypothetical protein CZ771_02630 [Actinomycetales bacterium JB111]